MSAIVTLLTDFGLADGYVAEMKGRLLDLAPGARLVDVAHDVAPGDVAAAAYVLGRTWRAFPAGTVHLAVVDPGVGTSRAALAAEAGGHRFVAPDNGLLTFVMDAAGLAAVALPTPAGAAPTFHGRDVFAPAAAALARGAPLDSLGSPVRRLARLAIAPAQRVPGGARGTVVHVDRFGTLVTNLEWSAPPRAARVHVAGRPVAVRTTFGDVAPGALVAYVGSAGTIEVAVRDGRADQALGVGRGAEVRLEAED